MKGRNLNIKLLDENCMPKRHLNGAAWDLRSNERTFTIKPGQTVRVGTGVKLDLPHDVCAMVMPRSGLGGKYGLHLRNTVGLIDPDYRGEVFLILGTKKEVEIEQYSRFAQILFLPYINVVNMLATTEISETERGETGFGASGVE